MLEAWDVEDPGEVDQHEEDENSFEREYKVKMGREKESTIKTITPKIIG